MREHLLPTQSADRFNLKQGSGGIVDIEFMVQFAVLAWAHRVPALAHWSDNVRILKSLAEAELFSQSEAEQLTEAYLDFRAAAHQLSLQQRPDEVAASQFTASRSAVTHKWRQLFGDG